MTDSTHEPELTPLASMLASIPEEAPPEDLEGRILRAIRSNTRRAQQPAPSSWRIALRVLIPAAAAFVVIMAILPGMLTGPPKDGRAGEQARVYDDTDVDPLVAAKAAPPERLQMRDDRDYTGDHAGGQPMAKRALPPPRAEGAYAARDSFSDSAKDGPTAFELDSLADAEEKVSSAEIPPVVDERPLWQTEGAPEQPWRDESGERQLIARKALDVEVEDIEEAHDDAQRIMERAHGHLVSESLQIRDEGRSQALMTMRLPLDQIDGVISQFRDLGRTLRLISDSSDRTREYYTQGTDVRDLGAQEEGLVKQYEAEANAARKQQLYNQIMANRDTNAAHKDRLLDLSDQTHSALLDLLLVERSGPIEFLPRAFLRMGRGVLWAAVTAVFWLPVLVLTWVVVRRAERRSSPPE